MWASNFPVKIEVEDVARLIDFSHSAAPCDHIGGFVYAVIPEEVVAREKATEEVASKVTQAMHVLGYYERDNIMLIRRSEAMPFRPSFRITL